jgi:3-hydroxybutyryl-CoA dehydrogenase
MSAQNTPIAVVGAGIMGAGIAQVAAQAGHPVKLHDAREGAAAEAKAKLKATLDGLVAKGKLTARPPRHAGRITPIEQLQQAEGAAHRLVVEAIVEDLPPSAPVPRARSALPAEAILATNTSSISVTAIANGLKHPQRLVGMHFFNPVPLMKLVEVVSGLQTEPAVARGDLRPEPRPGARCRCMPRARRASSSTASRGPTTPRRWRCCWSRPRRPRCSTPACAAPASAWGPAS